MEEPRVIRRAHEIRTDDAGWQRTDCTDMTRRMLGAASADGRPKIIPAGQPQLISSRRDSSKPSHLTRPRHGHGHEHEHASLGHPASNARRLIDASRAKLRLAWRISRPDVRCNLIKRRSGTLLVGVESLLQAAGVACRALRPIPLGRWSGLQRARRCVRDTVCSCAVTAVTAWGAGRSSGRWCLRGVLARGCRRLSGMGRGVGLGRLRVCVVSCARVGPAEGWSGCCVRMSWEVQAWRSLRCGAVGASVVLCNCVCGGDVVGACMMWTEGVHDHLLKVLASNPEIIRVCCVHTAFLALYPRYNFSRSHPWNCSCQQYYVELTELSSCTVCLCLSVR